MEYGNEGLSVYSIQTSHISKATFLISVSQNGMKSLCKPRQHQITDDTIYIYCLAFHYIFFLALVIKIESTEILVTSIFFNASEGPTFLAEKFRDFCLVLHAIHASKTKRITLNVFHSRDDNNIMQFTTDDFLLNYLFCPQIESVY